MLGYIVAFVIVLVIVEFITGMIFYDEFGDNMVSTIWIALIIVGVVLLIVETNHPAPIPGQQEDPLMQQLRDTEVDVFVDVIEEDQLNQVLNVNLLPQSMVIDSYRLNYDTILVSYNPESKQSCTTKTKCFSSQLIKHQDGTVWACERNYGMCYQYITQ